MASGRDSFHAVEEVLESRRIHLSLVSLRRQGTGSPLEPGTLNLESIRPMSRVPHSYTVSGPTAAQREEDFT